MRARVEPWCAGDIKRYCQKYLRVGYCYIRCHRKAVVRRLGQAPWSANEDECDWLGIGILTGLFKRKSEYRFSAVVCLFYQRVGRSIE